MKVNVNGKGHMTKMATIAINSKNLYKFETLPEASVNRALQSLYNHDTPDDLDLFSKVSRGRISQISGERLQDHWSSG